MSLPQGVLHGSEKLPHLPQQRPGAGSSQSLLHLTICCSSNTSLDSANPDFYTCQFCFSHPVWFLATSSPVPCYPKPAHSGGIHRPSAGRELNTTFRLRNAARSLYSNIINRKQALVSIDLRLVILGQVPSILLLLFLLLN